MAIPKDAFPLATQSQEQIRADIVRPLRLDRINFDASGGTAPLATMLSVNTWYVAYADVDCMICFNAQATNAPSNSLGLFIPANHIVSFMPPLESTGISVIGVQDAGSIFLQQLVAWAGMAPFARLNNQ